MFQQHAPHTHTYPFGLESTIPIFMLAPREKHDWRMRADVSVVVCSVCTCALTGHGHHHRHHRSYRRRRRHLVRPL